MDGFVHFMEVLAVCVAALIAVAAIFIVIVAYLPSSPLKEIMRAFSSRVSATAAVALIGLPLQPIPEIDGIYDIGGIVLLAFYWYGLVHKLRTARTASEARAHLTKAIPTLAQLFSRVKRFRKR